MERIQKEKSTYGKFLPPLFTSGPEGDFFTRFLMIFEKILSGIEEEEKNPKSLSEILDSISIYFYPNDVTPAEFLDWLASWVGLILKEDWNEERKRKALAQIIPLYRMRGTKTGLAEYLNIYTNGGVSVTDYGLFSVGINSQVEINTVVDAIDYFVVEVKLSDTDMSPEALERKRMMIESIIEREKPIHTFYKINWTNVSSLQVEVHSRVQIDTLLWTYP